MKKLNRNNILLYAFLSVAAIAGIWSVTNVAFSKTASATHVCGTWEYIGEYIDGIEVQSCTYWQPHGGGGLPVGTGGRVLEDCYDINAYTIHCTEIITLTNGTTTIGPWIDCKSGAVAISWNPLNCGPASGGGGGGDPGPCTTNCGGGPCTTNCGGASGGTQSLSLSVNCPARVLSGKATTADGIYPVTIWASTNNWSGAGSTDGAGNYAFGFPGSIPEGETMFASISGANVTSAPVSSCTPPVCTSACGPPPVSTYFDLMPETNGPPVLSTDASGNTIVGYSHKITNQCSATQNLNTSVDVYLHISKGYNQPDNIPGAFAATTLSSLAICASTPFPSPSGGINIGQQPGGSIICTHIGVRPYTNADPASFRNSVEQCSVVTAKPYLKAYGADVSAGGGYAPGCSVSGATAGSINTFGSVSGGNARGSAAQFGVTALLNINGFSSASLRTASPTAPKGLTFANSGNATADSTYGGGFGGSGICITDYWGTTQSSSQTPLPGAIPSNAGKKQYTLGSGSTIGSLTVPSGSQAAIFVDGDLYINGDITLAPTSGSGAANLVKLPSLAVVVHGNIYIAANVTRLDGIYVAQPGAAGTGKIYTCSPGLPPTPAYTTSNLDSECNQQLVINGGLIAQQVKFLRTANSLSDDTGQKPDFNNGSGTKASEVINYTPEIYLAPSALVDTNTVGTGSSGIYEAIYSLPPVY